MNRLSLSHVALAEFQTKLSTVRCLPALHNGRPVYYIQRDEVIYIACIASYIE